ncbi:MAG TPA: spermidine/putrescine ABC transporter substrate-binding protein, partial [Anaerolineae bacterium]|nr:spermidine/putrescine ABC transporter substrate-binding protein [Anaerolineae bacterium]
MRKYQGVFVIFLLFVALLLNACGAASLPAGEEQPAPAAVQEEAASGSSESGEPASGLDKELSVFNWADYIDEEVLANYEKEYGVDIIYDTFASNEDLIAKLQAGATGYDVIFPSGQGVAQVIQLGLVTKLDHNNIPNLKNIDPKFLDSPDDPGSQYCVPYQWGSTGIGYRKDVFGDTPPDSWAYLFDPEKAKMLSEKGGINVLNDQRELIGAALKYLGYSLNDTNEAHLEEAKE